MIEMLSEVQTMKMNRLLIAILALGAAAPSAHAAWVNCPSSMADNVSGTTACEYNNDPSVDQDFLNTNPLTVNIQGGLFDFTDWVYLDKVNYPDPTPTSGSYNFSGTANISAYGDLMLVFKSGNPTTLVGYLLADNTYSGTWTSPFESPTWDVNNPKGVSHISLYGRAPSTRVPEPSTLALLSLGLLGVGFASRRSAARQR